MAFQQGLSGLSSSAKALDVISHNVANANTTGFKANQTVFADVYSTTLGANPYMQVGSGVSVPAVRQNFTQGSITTTGNALDMAINGEGFFITKRPVANDLQMFYTRAGEFQLDKDGYVISANGYQLLGYPGAAGAGDPQPIRVPFDAGKPAETSQVEMTFNLDAGQPAITATFDANDPDTYNFSTSVQVYDSLGIAHNLTFYFQKQPLPTPPTGQVDWKVYASFDGDSTLVTTNPLGTLTFDGAGALTSSPNLTVNVTSPLANGAKFGGNGDGAVDVTFNATQYSLASSVTTLSQDGQPAGELASVSVTKEGRLQARYTNGDVKDIATVAIATFRNPNALISMGDNMWAASLESGQAAAGIPGSGTRGFISGGAVESSNVDLTAELVNMIIQQRAYQANAQSIRTQDQILQTVINLR
ncbi:MAG: flagellar hook protein FlgE [Hydrogenophilus sp.]